MLVEDFFGKQVWVAATMEFQSKLKSLVISENFTKIPMYSTITVRVSSLPTKTNTCHDPHDFHSFRAPEVPNQRGSWRPPAPWRPRAAPPGRRGHVGLLGAKA